MLSGLQIALLLLGALLLIATLPPVIARIVGGRASPLLARALRVGLGIAGATLIVSVLATYASSPTRPGQSVASEQSAPAAPAAANAPSAPPDLVAMASEALEGCAVAAAPAVPDGANASLGQMTAAQSAFKAYDAATLAYVNCVDAVTDRISTQFGATAPAAELARLKTFGTSAHNSAIDREQALADQFNAQVRVYKARHPGQPPHPPHA
jgi:hypothetical protein